MNAAPNGAGRIACLLIKELPLWAAMRANPALRESPFALAAGQGPRAMLGFVSDSARHLGIQPGMTATQAHAVIPDLAVLQRSAASEQAAADALLDAAGSFSPVIEAAAPGLVYLDLAGLGGLYGSEPQMAQALLARVRQVGLEAAVGIAANKEIAALAARCGGVRIIAPGQENEFLAWVPLELLELGPELEFRLERLGVRRMGDLARLNEREVGSRMGTAAVALMRLARGVRGAPLQVQPLPELFSETLELEYALEMLEPLSFVMRAMLERLCARLQVRGLSAGELTLALKLADHRRDERKLTLAAQTSEPRVLLSLLMLELEKTPPAAAVERIELGAQARVRHAAQSDFFLPPTPAPERLQTTLARLAALCGPEHVGSLRPTDSWRPEAIECAAFAPPPPSPAPDSEDPKPCPVLLRALRPPQEIEMLFSGRAPVFVRGDKLGARVISQAGPWRRCGEWWQSDEAAECARPGGFARDYYDLALDDGGVYRVFCDLNSNRWFVDGVYD